MPAPLPLRYEGEGEFQAPRGHWCKRADAEFVIGEVYRMAPVEDRSIASHNHQFAEIAEAWKNLPERFHNQPWAQSAEHLRKYALIRTGFCDTQTFACGSRAEAMRWASNLRPIDEYSVVTVEGTTVYRFTAQSQSMRAMGKQRFQESKQAILDWLDDLLEVERGTIARNAGRAA